MKTIRVGQNEETKSINEAIKIASSPCEILLVDPYYREKVIINKDNITINGQNKATIDYDDYAIKIHKDGREYVTFRTYTLLIKANHIELKNLTVSVK